MPKKLRGQLAAASQMIGERLRQQETDQAEFMASLGPSYPLPRAKQEWHAYWKLRRWWDHPTIRGFIEAYACLAREWMDAHQ